MQRLKHPEHGYHVPMPGEVDGMLKNGWVWEESEAVMADLSIQPTGGVDLPESIEFHHAPMVQAPQKIDRRRREHRNANR